MTEKGKDFKKGGAFVIYKNKKTLIEDMLRTADIIIYKFTIKHGVDEIDDDKKIDLNESLANYFNEPLTNFLTR